MPHFTSLAIMPKETMVAPPSFRRVSAPYPVSTTTSTGLRNAAIWSAADDEILLQARASGLNWGPISTRHFPGKTPNACRKRHERLIEKRQGEDWDAGRLERLAQEYAAVRREMWEPLATRLGMRWTHVEAKCMEKGLKNLLATARSAEKRNNPSQDDFVDEQGISDHHSDSGIGLGSDAEMEVDETGPSRKQHTWPTHAETIPQQQTRPQQPHLHSDHTRSRSLPHTLPPLPLYCPPPPITNTQRRVYDFDGPMTTSPATMSFVRHTSKRYSPESNGRGGISIQSVLSSPAPQYA